MYRVYTYRPVQVYYVGYRFRSIQSTVLRCLTFITVVGSVPTRSRAYIVVRSLCSV